MFCPDFLHSGTQHWSVYQCGCARLRRSELFGLLWANQFFGTIKKRTSSFSHGDPYEFGFRLRSYGSHSETEGISHGLKKCPPDTFLPCFAGSAFKVNCCAAAREGGLGHSIPTQIITKKRAPAKAGARFFMVTRTGIEPMLPP